MENMHLFVISGFALSGIFVLFLVIAKTLNNIVNHFSRIEYYLLKEAELTEELVEIRQILEAEKKEELPQPEPAQESGADREKDIKKGEKQG
jgi:hypothetical protein